MKICTNHPLSAVEPLVDTDTKYSDLSDTDLSQHESSVLRSDGDAHDAGGQGKGKGKGKGKAGITDEDFARSLFAEDAVLELTDYAGSLSRLRSAGQPEKDQLLEEFLEDKAVRGYHLIVADLAATLRPLQMENYQSVAVQTSEPSTSEESTPIVTWGPFGRLPGASSSFHTRKDENVCTACLCELKEGKFVKLECGSKYDTECLKAMFEATFDDEYLFPPRCCARVIKLSYVKEFISQEALERYEAKSIEYSTPSRLYCSNMQCQAFLGGRQDTIASISCPSCNTETCAVCSAHAHAGSARCKVDKGMRKALKLGQSNGWQRCPKCRSLVERDNGCFHMSCRCGADFCYLCAADWNECECKYKTSRLLRLLGLRWLHLRGNYLVKNEPAAKVEGRVVRLCKRSWKSVVKTVSPAR